MQIDVLLLSGGADSIYLYNKYKYDKYIFFNYSQKHIAHELNVLEDLNLKNIDIIDIDDLKQDKKGFYYSRNLKFVLNVLDSFKEDISNLNSITFGTNKVSTHPDNNREFFNLLESLIEKSYKQKIKLKTPLKDIHKKDINNYLDKKNIRYYTD